MTRVDSPLKDRMIFTIGARRSGTYWMQRIVTAHPDVAAVPGETMLFSHGIAPLFERFHHGTRGSGRPGLLYVDRNVLLDAARDFSDQILGEYAVPGVHFLAERSPLHINHVGLMAAIYPDARFVHIVRDGRDVARSLVSMEWGPSSIEDAALEWRASVSATRTGTLPERYVEMRYEDLIADPRAQIAQLYARLGLRDDDSAVDAGVAEAGVSLNMDPNAPAVGIAKWRTALSHEELGAFMRVSGDVLAEFGYTAADEPTNGPAAGAREEPVASPPSGDPSRASLASRSRNVALRALPTRRERSSPPARDTTALAHAGQALLDAFLDAVHTVDFNRLEALMAENLSLRLVDEGGERRHHGAKAREELIRALREDPAFRGRQIVGDILVGVPTITAVLSYRLEDGSPADRVLAITPSTERAIVTAIALYRFPLESTAAPHM